MPTLHHRGHTLSYVEEGAGPPAVLLHSGGLSSRQWGRLVAQLARGYHVLAPDFLGYGGSSRWPRDAPFELDDDAHAIEALLDRLDAPPHLIGHSYGGLIALRIAMRRPVASLCVYEPVAFGVHHDGADAEALADMATTAHLWDDPAHGGDEAWLRSFVDYWSGGTASEGRAAGGWDALAPAFKRGYLDVGRKVYQEAHAVWGDRTPLEAYARIDVPTLILSGERSPVAERRVCSRLAGIIPRSQLILVGGAGHMGPLTHTDDVNAKISAHLGSTTLVA